MALPLDGSSGGGRCLFHWLGGIGGVCGGCRCSAGGPKDCDASFVRWVVVAVAVQKGLHRHLVLCLFRLTLNSPDAVDIVHWVLFLCSICHRGLLQPLWLGNFLVVGAI